MGIWFWVLAVGEPAIYALIAALSHAVPIRRGTGAVPSQSTRPVPFRAAARARVAAVIAGASAMLGIGSAAEAVAQPHLSQPCEGEVSHALRVEDELGPNAGRGAGQLLRQAQALQAQGLSLRGIARALGVRSKSTFQRMLAAAAHGGGEAPRNSLS